MPESGNNEQNFRVAESIATAVVDKILRKHPELKGGASAGERLMQWLPLVVAVATAFWTLAIQSKQVEENSSDILKLEARSDSSQTALQTIDSRLARIETMLDIITGGEEPRGYARPR